MCCKIRGLSAPPNAVLHAVVHAALRAFSSFVFSVRFRCASKLHIQIAQFAVFYVAYIAAHQKRIALQQTVSCTSKLHIQKEQNKSAARITHQLLMQLEHTKLKISNFGKIMKVLSI
jgi:hypothetical protein